MMDIDDSVVTEASSSSVVKKEETIATDAGNSTSGADSDITYHEEEDNCEDGDSDYYGNDDDDDYDDCMYADDDEDNYAKMQSQFDNVDLPPGVEISLPWMETVDAQAASSSSMRLKSGATTNSAPVHKMEEVAFDSSAAIEEWKQEEAAYKGFKIFDTVEEFTDHHYADAGLAKKQNPGKKWLKKVQEEWSVLEKNLPDTIYVRVSEKRMDLLRAVIIGPAGTPYHDGLFSFDAIFPPQYPDVPPMVFYYSGGLRLNPNLYDSGKVCLSLLHTWSGDKDELWIPGKSTMLQVLVSIQALILNANPIFNEPGLEPSDHRAEDEEMSRKYNNDVFILSLKTMMYTLRRPPLHFEDLVVGHFRARGHDIMAACRAYMEGVPVGSPANREAGNGECPIDFKLDVTKMMTVLIKLFANNGSKHLEKFLPKS